MSPSPSPNRSRSSSKSAHSPTAAYHDDDRSRPTVEPLQPRQQFARRRRQTSRRANQDDIEARPLQAGFYLNNNLSGVSMDSSVLLDHREQVSMRPRRASTAPAFDPARTPMRYSQTPHHNHNRHSYRYESGYNGNEDRQSSDDDEDTPLMRRSVTERSRRSPPGTSYSGYNRNGTISESQRLLGTAAGAREYGGVNFPPSVPTSPQLEGSRVLDGFPDLNLSNTGETVIHISGDGADNSYPPSSSAGSARSVNAHMRGSMFGPEQDVCFPVDDGLMDEVEADIHEMESGRRLRRREWPDLNVLEEWSREEKEERSEGIRAKKLPDPVYVGGRLRPPVRATWHRDEEDAPYRFTYFNEELPATIHSHTISELVQPGQTFADLFRPEPRVIDESSSEDEEPPTHTTTRSGSNVTAQEPGAINTPPEPSQALPRLGPRPTFWLDVYHPTDAEMKVISKAFGIHPLTSEDIMMQEAREKVELFRSYYLVSYRTFEQDPNSEDYMDPVNIYVVVFRDGVISFHFSMTPHPANVRRRIRQLKDYITVSADWISYALIDDITDAFQPLIQSLEKEVDDIDDAILRMHLESGAPSPSSSSQYPNNKRPTTPSTVADEEQKSDGDMLKRVGDSRRNVMSLYRLMGNKADVIKGFAKRCNEHWQVAPRSEIGLYLGDIQDHIVTMVSNLNHMEKILSRSHSNYLAQINIKMNERQEQTADVLGRLTVLGTIVLPMNIITGLWGMNVMVPGQTVENLDWFWCIAAGLVFFGFFCYYVAKRVYQIM